MNKIGRKLYYDLVTGEVIVDTGERMGSVVPTTVERDIEVYTVLSERNRETFDVLELNYGDYSGDFSDAISYRVNVETKEIEFAYPTGEEDEGQEEIVYQAPLSEKVVVLEEKLSNQEQMYDTMGEELVKSKMENIALQEQLDLVGAEVTSIKINLLMKG